jgi:hypothetical protein
MSGSNTAAIALNNTLLQIRAADEYRGRVNSLTFLQRGLVPLGTTGAGFSVEVVGPALTVAAMGLLIVIIVIGIALRWPALRRVT